MTANTSSRTWIEPLNIKGLLRSVMAALVGDAQIIIEGDFNPSEFEEIYHIAAMPITNDTPRESPGSRTIIALSLEPETLLPLNDMFEKEELMDRLEAIQILKTGTVQFVAGDYFHPECVSVGPTISPAILKQWITLGLIGLSQPTPRH